MPPPASRTCVAFTGMIAASLAVACRTVPGSAEPVFIDGRAVAVVDDSLLAFTRQGDASVIIRDRGTDAVYTRGAPTLRSPRHVQEMGGRWYVSDMSADGPLIVVFDAGWTVQRVIRLADLDAVAHEFAVLPNGKIVVESGDGRLVAIGEDSTSTFALAEQGPRPGLLLAVSGGVLHAVPQRQITLYNGNGHIRWRLPWPWREDAYVSDIGVDSSGRIHVLGGESGEPPDFVCFTLSATTGEVLRWSAPGPAATFTVDRIGEIRPDSVSHWLQ